MKLSKTQELRLENALGAHLKRIEAQKTERDIALRQADERIAAQLHAEDAEIRKAVDDGVPKDRIRVKLGIGHATLNDSLARTATLTVEPDLEEEAAAHRFAWADDEHSSILITLAGAEWDAQRKEMEPRIRRNGDKDSGTYRMTEDGALVMRTDSFDMTNANRYDHPVTAWLLYFGGLDETRAWIAAQDGAIAA